jgi:hypothetical protein
MAIGAGGAALRSDTALVPLKGAMTVLIETAAKLVGAELALTQ